ncbi:MAG: AsmA family protein [Deltaproteobacteria bacterium]|nr:AsmA family protein [Deltaproteobacteria bacterium]
MRQYIKYTILSLAILLSLLAITVMLLPLLIDVQQYVPRIEKKISNITGRRFILGQDLKVSIFPRLTVSCSDVSLGNPPGFAGGRFLTVDSFEVGLKLLPLLKHQFKVSRFTIKGLELNLEKQADGHGNWQIGDSAGESDMTASGLPEGDIGLLMEELAVPLISISDSRISWSDSHLKNRHEITDLMLNLRDITLNKTFAADCSGVVRGRPVHLEGTIGPLARFFEHGILEADLRCNLFDNLSVLLKGQFEDGSEGFGYNFDLKIAPFPPKVVWADVTGDPSVITAYPGALNTLSVKSRIKGTAEWVVFEDGAADLDDSHINFSCSARHGAEPDIKFAVEMDTVNLSRYLRPHKGEFREDEEKSEGSRPGSGYSLLRRAGVEGTIGAGEVQFHGGKFSDVKIKLAGRNGLYTADPVNFSFYQGQVRSKVTFDIRQVRPVGSLELHAEDIEVASALHDIFDVDLLRGRMNGDINLTVSGDSTVSMAESLNGEGSLQLSDGILLGYELAGAVAGSYDAAADSGVVRVEKHIGFSEFAGSATVQNGILEIHRAELYSPAATLQAEGTADLTAERMDLKISSNKKVFIIGKERAERYAMPLSLQGTFSDLKFGTGDERIAVGGQRVFVGEIDIRRLVDDTIPVPVGEDGKNLVGKTLVDPVVIAERFGLHPEIISKTKAKKKFRQGTGKIQISPLREGVFLPLQ